MLDQFTATSVLNAQKPNREGNGNTGAASLFSAGTLATTDGGHGTQFGLPIPTISSADEAATFVADRLAEGSDWIKIVYEPSSPVFKSIDKGTLVALVEAAHTNDVLAVVHVSSRAAAKDAIDAGADGLVHIFADEIVDDETVEKMVAQGMFVVPTLSVIASATGKGLADDLMADPLLAPMISDMQKANLTASFGNIPAFENLFRLENALENVRILHRAGVAILAGTDAPNPGTTYGISMHGELELLVGAGLSPAEALHAATLAPAEAFNLPTRGRIGAGARADLLLVTGDPTSDITAARNIKSIYRNGFVSPRLMAPEPEEAEAPARSAAAPVTDGLVSSFDTDLFTGFGVPWVVTTDQLANGSSTATPTHQTTDENGHLNVTGEVTTKFLFPWAGAGVFFSQDFSVDYDLSPYDAISFRTKGDPRTLSLMFFTRTSMQRPTTATFNVTEEWQDFSFNLSDIRSLAADEVFGFAITASRPEGEFSFDVDDVVYSSD